MRHRESPARSSKKPASWKRFSSLTVTPEQLQTWKDLMLLTGLRSEVLFDRLMEMAQQHMDALVAPRRNGVRATG